MPVTPSDPNDPKIVSSSIPEEATCYRGAPADPDATGYRNPVEQPEVMTQYGVASADPSATGYTPTPTAGREAKRRRTLPCRFGDSELLEEIARVGRAVVY